MKNSRFLIIMVLPCLLTMTGCNRPMSTRMHTESTRLELRVNNQTGWVLKIFRDSVFMGTIINDNQVTSLDNLKKSEIIYLHFYLPNSNEIKKKVKLAGFDSIKVPKVDLTLYFDHTSFDSIESVCRINYMRVDPDSEWIKKVCFYNDTSDADEDRCRDIPILWNSQVTFKPNAPRDIWDLKFITKKRSLSISITGVYDPTIKTIIIDDL